MLWDGNWRHAEVFLIDGSALVRFQMAQSVAIVYTYILKHPNTRHVEGDTNVLHLEDSSLIWRPGDIQCPWYLQSDSREGTEWHRIP